jgi:hypothetical protein
MTNSVPGNDRKTRKGRCWSGRIAGIIGVLLALWTWGYALVALQKDPKEMPAVILIGLMIIGGLIDCVRIGREGMGGVIVVLSGIIFYIFLILDKFVLRQFYSTEAQIAAFLGTIILFLSGFLFYWCGRKRRKLKA